MAQEKVIGLRIELNGFRGVVTSIKQLEEELRKAKEDLNELEIGSDNFKTLTREISSAESKLMDLRKASEGIGIEKKLEGYGKLASGITSSFAAAQAAVSLFGNDSTAVAEAAAQAQNLLTVALAARGVEELAVGLKTTAAVIATKAATAANALETASTFTLNGALKLLYTTIAANPIGALVAVIGLAVTAMYAFSNSTEETVSVQKQLATVVSDEAIKLKLYTSILKDSNSSNYSRLAVINDLKKTYPGFNVFLDEDNRLTKAGVTFINAKTQALLLQAKAQELVKKITENETELIKLNNKTVDESLTSWQQFTNWYLANTSPFGAQAEQALDSADAIKNNSAEVKKNKSVQKDLEEALKKTTDEQGKLLKIVEEGEKAMKKQADEDAKSIITKDKQVKATKAQIKAEKELNDQLEKLGQQYKDTYSLIQELGKTSEVGIGKPKIVTDLEAIEKARKDLLQNPLEKAFEDIGFSVKVLDGQLVGLNDTVTTVEDSFGIFYDKSREILSKNVFIQGVKDFSKTIGDELELASKKLLNKEITKEAYDSLVAITQQYKQLNTLLKTPPGIEEVFDPKSLQEFLDTTKNLAIKTGDYKYELDGVTGAISEVNGENIDYSDNLQKQAENIEIWTKKLTIFYSTQFSKEKDAKEALVKRLNLLPEQESKILETSGKITDEVSAIIDQIVKEQIKGVQTLTNTIIIEENAIRAFLKETQDAVKEGTAISADAVKELLLKNKELVYKTTQETNKIIIDAELDKADKVKSVDKFVQDLKRKGVDITNFTEKEKLDLYKYYLDEQVKATDEAEKKKEEAQKKTIENIQLVLQTVSKSLTDIASITAQMFQLQLDALSMKYNDTMESIVGDTKEADQKRIESEKSYQAQKAEIEKKARITALKFTLAQAIASGAQAVVSALAVGGPAGFVIAGIDAAITAAQVAVIASQIQQATQLRRGGLLAGGGFINGPSHEQGGVYAGGGYTLEGNESVINRQSTLQYSGLLSAINQSGGGRPIMVQSPMDSRLVEALAKQRTEPIRAYVIEQDITKAQAINRRLEQLASF